tara:strand:+ start:1447 stop:2130 length:684 start_codon:yes stop_codon:yes gene_type:complete
MKLHFKIDPESFKLIEELPNAWNKDNYEELLNIMEYGDTSDLSLEELKDMCLLYLSDNEPDEAATIVLQYIFGERLKKGQIDTISHDMQEEKIWEEYADLSMHEEFFNATQLLYEAFNGKFPHPEAIQFKVKITAMEKSGYDFFDEDTEANLIRLLVQGMEKNTLINRLFDEQIEDGDFEEAQDILWQYKKEKDSESTTSFDIISSKYWLHNLKYAEAFEAVLITND